MKGESPKTAKTKIARDHIAITTITDIITAIRPELVIVTATEVTIERKSADIDTRDREETAMMMKARVHTKDGIAMTTITRMTSARMKSKNPLRKSARVT